MNDTHAARAHACTVKLLSEAQRLTSFKTSEGGLGHMVLVIYLQLLCDFYKLKQNSDRNTHKINVALA